MITEKQIEKKESICCNSTLEIAGTTKNKTIQILRCVCCGTCYLDYQTNFNNWFKDIAQEEYEELEEMRIDENEEFQEEEITEKEKRIDCFEDLSLEGYKNA